jgi:3-hydroxyisobutyrate dehydrogenase-like beta-hydroxyacid dehydrogenase
VGEEPRVGSAFKLTGNFFIVAAIETLAEGMTLGDWNGIRRRDLLSFFDYMLPGTRVQGGLST